jgi:hypothetical protein
MSFRAGEPRVRVVSVQGIRQHPSTFVRRRRLFIRARMALLVLEIERHDLADVVLGLGVRGHLTPMLPHRVRAGIVRGDHLHHVPVEHVGEDAQVAGAALDVVADVERILDVHLARGGGHQLHQPLRADG